MPFWRPPKLEDLAREMCEGSGKDPDGDADATTVISMVPVGPNGWPTNLKNWQLYLPQAEGLLAILVQELTGKNMPAPLRILQYEAKPDTIVLGFRTVAQADTFARIMQALRMAEGITEKIIDAPELPTKPN